MIVDESPDHHLWTHCLHPSFKIWKTTVSMGWDKGMVFGKRAMKIISFAGMKS